MLGYGNICRYVGVAPGVGFIFFFGGGGEVVGIRSRSGYLVGAL